MSSGRRRSGSRRRRRPTSDIPYLTQSEDLRAFCERARAVGRIGMDTEFVRDKTYYPKLALVQLIVEDQIYLVDPLDRIDLSPLDALVLDPDVEKVLHAATQDLEIFFYRTKAAPRNIFDTQVAAALVGLGHQVGYATLTKKVLGVSLTKDSQYTDWLRRPLSETQERYAAADVEYLFPLREHLVTQLEEMKRMPLLREECALLEPIDNYHSDPAESYRRIKGRRGVKGTRLSALRALGAWREKQAQKRNLPRRWVLPDDTLIALARNLPESLGELASIRGLSGRVQAQHGADILATIAKGRTQPPPASAEKAAELSARGRAAMELVSALVRSLCHAQRIAPAVVSTTAVIEDLVAQWEADSLEKSDNPLLKGWRSELFGSELIDFLNGTIQVSLDSETGLLVIHRP